MQLHLKQPVLFTALFLLMAATRYNHFGSSIALPDATLAVFLLAGFFFGRMKRLALPLFAILILGAGMIDYYAINVAGTSDWCVTPAYWLLIPTYAIMWFGGYWLAAHRHNSWRGLALFAAVSWLATTLAFMVSNTSFFLLSGYFPEMDITEYAVRIVQYYPPYLSGSLLYLALAMVGYLSLTSISRNRATS